MTEISALWLYTGLPLGGRVIGPKVTCNSLGFQNALHIISRRRLGKQKQERTLASHWHQYDKLAPSSLVFTRMLLTPLPICDDTLVSITFERLRGDGGSDSSWLLKEPSVPWGACLTGYRSGEVSFKIFYPISVTCGDICWAVRACFLMQDGEDAQNLLWDGERVGAGRILPPDEGFAIQLIGKYGWKEGEATKAMGTIVLEPGCGFVKYSIRLVSW